MWRIYKRVRNGAKNAFETRKLQRKMSNSVKFVIYYSLSPSVFLSFSVVQTVFIIFSIFRCFCYRKHLCNHKLFKISK